MNIGILGTGSIARKMAQTVNGMDGVSLYAVGSRSRESAERFAAEFDIPQAYGSYVDLAADDSIDLIYIATPHSRHYEDCMLCLEHGRNVLCEKAFTANSGEARRVFEFAQSKGLFIGEAMWTRFMPTVPVLKKLIADGVIGEIRSLTADLGYHLDHKERFIKPELAGGCLLDIGIYPLNFAVMVLGKNITEIKSSALMNEYGVDLHDSMILTFDGKIPAVLSGSGLSLLDNRGIIYGDLGRIEYRNINNCEGIDVILDSGETMSYDAPKKITGYEYEVRAALDAIAAGKTECEEMTHEETLFMMGIMDRLRREWGISYPFEDPADLK